MGMSICDWYAMFYKAARGTSCLVCHVLGLREVFLRSLYNHQELPQWQLTYPEELESPKKIDS